ncbi:MAG: hypothetical protein M9898_02280 [Chitinophagaceae bacterium]|nr:hypothetical protein [Chitinophagaceae bacterium]
METSVSAILKRINLCTTIVIVAVSIGCAVMLFYQPVPKDSAVIQKNEALEELRKSDLKIVNAKLDSIRVEQQNINKWNKEKDDELSKKLDENTNALKNNRNEKPRDFSNYNSMQLQGAVTDLVRQYKVGKR